VHCNPITKFDPLGLEEATFTAYIEEPDPGSGKPYAIGFGNSILHGHAFAGLELHESNKEYIRGFYPKKASYYDALLLNAVSGGVEDDAKAGSTSQFGKRTYGYRDDKKQHPTMHRFTYKMAFEIDTKRTPEEIYKFLEDYNKNNKYEFDDSACVRFVTDFAEFVGADLPKDLGKRIATPEMEKKLADKGGVRPIGDYTAPGTMAADLRKVEKEKREKENLKVSPPTITPFYAAPLNL
jgi:hypothetical protein